MAGLHFFAGMETGGLEEWTAINGSPSVDTSVVRTGNYALKISVTGDYVEYDDSNILDDQVYGFGFYTEDATPAADRIIFQAYNPSDNLQYEIVLLSSGKLRIRRYVLGVPYNHDGTTILNDKQWYWIELYWYPNYNGEFQLNLDSFSEITASNIDTLEGSAMTAYVRLHGAAEVFYYDDYYQYESCASVEDFLGPRTEVLGPFQNTAEDATDQGTTLDQGTWADTGDTPGNDEATPAGYTGDAESGYTICDEGNRDGPAALITGTAKGAKWIHRLSRGNGSGTTHSKVYGKNTSTTSETEELSSSWENFFTVSEDTTYMPNSNTDKFTQGFAKSAGGRDIYCAEMWAFLLHVAPDPSTLDLSDMDFPDQNYYLGPFST